MTSAGVLEEGSDSMDGEVHMVRRTAREPKSTENPINLGEDSSVYRHQEARKIKLHTFILPLKTI